MPCLTFDQGRSRCSCPCCTPQEPAAVSCRMCVSLRIPANPGTTRAPHSTHSRLSASNSCPGLCRGWWMLPIKADVPWWGGLSRSHHVCLPVTTSVCCQNPCSRGEELSMAPGLPWPNSAEAGAELARPASVSAKSTPEWKPRWTL